ncbi:hypothetical protein DFP73DRAFT_484055 [Morchella snyderi]|nr:hypothetical protein DFP73DRAFT_484055 [Morchella snyderi]
MRFLGWPALSTDFNPMENVWRILKDRVSRRHPWPNGTEEMKTAVTEEWEKI